MRCDEDFRVHQMSRSHAWRFHHDWHRRLHHVSRIGLLCAVLLVLDPAAQASSAELSPLQVIHQWMRLYPQKLSQVVTLTTPAFRHHRSVHQWIATEQQAIHHTRFRYLTRQLVSAEIIGNTASIVLDARVSTDQGTHTQRERYTLHRFCTVWLIDAIQVTPNPPEVPRLPSFAEKIGSLETPMPDIKQASS
ncbi:MAG: hypothetical protein D6704_01475 [Nitrospirae bacterium]|nr:MAG: hypothetical protein D6704_01475 [Nitrospirota bacterium]